MNARQDCCSLRHTHTDSRRTLLKSAVGCVAMGMVGGLALGVPELSFAAALTKDVRDKLTPAQIIDSMKQGNERLTIF